MKSPWYFTLLDIEPTDDQRAIKRAYAAQLKRIDQETEAEAFARLRQAYELAREWRDDESEGEADYDFAGALDCDAERVAASSAPAMADVSAGAVLSAVAVEPGMGFQARLDAPPLAASALPILRETGELVGQLVAQVRKTPLAASALLAEALEAPELESLDARARFEVELAEWLCHFPQSTGALFEAMAEAFGWRHGLPELAWEQARWLEQVMDEWQRWCAKDAQECAMQRRALADAAAGAIPSRNDDPDRWRDLLRHHQWVSLWLTPTQVGRWRHWLGTWYVPSASSAAVNAASGTASGLDSVRKLVPTHLGWAIGATAMALLLFFPLGFMGIPGIVLSARAYKHRCAGNLERARSLAAKARVGCWFATGGAIAALLYALYQSATHPLAG